MKKIVLSIGTLVVVGVVVVGATGAFYGDTETSTGNTFTAGSIELKVDSESHYNGMVCTESGWQPSDNPAFGDPVGFPVRGTACKGTWDEADLGAHKFFYFEDLKPGDHGEDTISLHVYDNDAWGQFVVSNVYDRDNSCTDPEQEEENGNCGKGNPDENGEIGENLLFTAWLDQGLTPGFQNGNKKKGEDGWDSEEGDNIMNPENKLEQPFWSDEIANADTWELSEVLSEAYGYFCADNDSVSADGHNDYGVCHGLAEDGRMVGSTTYYFGLAWDLDLDTTGNDVQTDSYIADLTFQVEQRRNNPNPFSI